MNLLAIGAGTSVLPLVIGGFAFLLVLIFVIEVAVASATKKMLHQLTLQNNLKILELSKKGVTAEEIQDAISRSFR